MIVTDEMCRPLAEFLGGDALAVRAARSLYHYGVTTVDDLRSEWARPVPPGYEPGWTLQDASQLGPKGLERIAERVAAEDL